MLSAARVDPLALVILEGTGTEYVKSVLEENVSGTRCSFAAVSGGQNRPVAGQFIEAVFQFVQRDMVIAL